MLSLKIDGVACTLIDRRVTLPTYSAAQLRDPNAEREGMKLRLGVASTPESDALFGYAADIYRSTLFNDSYHTALFEVDGVVLYEGVATLEEVEYREAGNIYHIAIRSGGAEWADSAAVTRLNRSLLSASFNMTLNDIEASWYGDKVVRMLPLRRDSYPEPVATGQYTPQRVWMPHDYHPFISVRRLLNSIAASSGYTLHSTFLDTPFARKLMFSGAYRGVDSITVQHAMGFKALRSAPSTAQAGEDGRVAAWEPRFGSNIGAIVDTVNPATTDENGVPLGNAFSNGGCFTFEGGRPTFTPKREVSVAFDVHLRYTTDFKIYNSRRLQGFDTIHLCPGCDVKIELHNNYVNQRDEVVGGRAYNLFIFDYDADSQYRLTGAGEVSSAISSVVMEAQAPTLSRLYVRGANDQQWSIYKGDWALYDAHVTGEGRCSVEVTLRTPFARYTPTSPMVFNDIFFGGAEPGQSLTLERGCSIEPIFSGAPGYGESVEFEDVANVDISQMELIAAIAHLFNLRFYTHRPTRRLFIEPYDDFFNGAVVDWRSRQLSEGVRVRDGAVESFEQTTLGYKPADMVATRTAGDDETFGSWSHRLHSYASKHSSDSRLNPLFMPTVSLDGASNTAPTAEVLTIGDRDILDESSDVEPRIILYHGIRPLPTGEVWCSALGDEGYPHAAFHSATAGETLCFEDRDGCEGLHRYYDSELQEEPQRGMLTCYMYLPPSDYVALLDPNSEGANIRSRFRLSVAGNSSLFILERLERYDAESMVALCTFRRLMTD